ncbi:MAG TPA: hypothetical protein VN306_03195 [Mycobacterium sp.]|nr:hypothetical protein [Mycobacterium sp.]
MVLFVGLLWLAFYAARRVDAKHEERAALVARADQQHAWVLAGDDRTSKKPGQPTPAGWRSVTR